MSWDTPDTDAIEDAIAAALEDADGPLTTDALLDRLEDDDRVDSLTLRELHYALLRLYDKRTIGSTAEEEWADGNGEWALADDDAVNTMRPQTAAETEQTFPIGGLPNVEAVGRVWVAQYTEGTDTMSTRVATTARAAAYLALADARYQPAPVKTAWELRGRDVYGIADPREFGWEARDADIHITCHDLQRPTDVDALDGADATETEEDTTNDN